MRMRTHKAGLRLSALIMEIMTDTTRVAPNWANICPVMPGSNMVGPNTAARTSEVANIGAATSFIACSVASRGDIFSSCNNHTKHT